jgi:hypothetical protein
MKETRPMATTAAAAPTPFVLRCTTKLGRALPFEIDDEVPDTIPRLNQWHARLLDGGEHDNVLITQQRSSLLIAAWGICRRSAS